MMQVYPEEKDKNIKMVHLNDKMQVTLQSFLIIIFGIVFCIAIFIASYKVMPLGVVLLNIAIIIIAFGLQAYNVHCVQTGQCYVWAWILTVLICSVIVLFIVSMILSKGSMSAVKSVKSAR